MSLWTGSAKIHELYTAACGLYVCWLSIRAITVLLAWMPQGRRVILLKVQEWTLMVMLCNTVMTINTHRQHTLELLFF
jgi:E3 ubiquitin-protein ligase MARCH6